MVNYIPTSLKEALQIRASNDVIPYGGGTDLMIEAPEDANYLFLYKVSELRQIKKDGEYIRIGAACTYSEIMESPLCPPVLREAIELIAAPAIRNTGTIGGNIANGSPKADSALIFFAADAKLLLMSAVAERTIPIKDFYLGRNKTALKPDELIVEILMPVIGSNRYYYKKVGAREALAISRLSFVGLFGEEGGRVKKLAVAFGAVSDVIIRRDDLDAMLIGKTIAEAKSLKADYLSAYDSAVVPIRGRVSEEYRKDFCMALLRDFLERMGI